jgi:hypothetical protein
MTTPSDVLELLTAQHEELVELAGRAQRDPALVGELADKLATHLAIERELFYPHVSLIAPIEEHAQLMTALSYVLAGDPERLAARIRALASLIERHIAREDELFETLSQVLPDGALAEIGDQVRVQSETASCIGT